MSEILHRNGMAGQYNHVRIAGIPDRYFDIRIKNGKFKSVRETGHTEHAGHKEPELWFVPGLIDLHTHLGWTDFDMEDQQKRSHEEIFRMRGQALDATLHAGFTGVRDAGGLLPEEVRRIRKATGCPLRVFPCGGMFRASSAEGISGLEHQTENMQETGAGWIKIFATGGLGAPADKVLEPAFGREEFLAIVRKAHACGMKTMIHSWGGISVDWAIEAGADTLEHGVYLTGGQAGRMAEAGISYIPTTAIYRIAADPDGVLGLSQVLRDRAARAALQHPKAVQRALDAGVKIGFGTDFATPALHGSNLQELFSLMDCGLNRQEAWQAATGIAAEILGYQDILGKIQEGFISDAVICNKDPLQAENAEELKKSIITVMTGAPLFGSD